jgi:hypothetical protein
MEPWDGFNLPRVYAVFDALGNRHALQILVNGSIFAEQTWPALHPLKFLNKTMAL